MKTRKHPELLAPAGSPDAAWAAFTYGADAVYAGLPRFSARAEADNFSAQQLDELIGYAHAHGKKVYMAFNTLVQQHELADALEALALIYDLRTDGVIVQDMGVVRMTQRFFPDLELHASTQLAVHNPDGAKLLADLGFARVVLARELSLKEIKTITRDCGIETEVFIHGALCYSYSGLCLFSSHLTGRSGNRGRCAYCCRQTFGTDKGKGLPFSMKDFAVGESFDELLETSVSSLKIEGRMKGPAYVGAVTDFYRKRMDHGLSEPQQRKLLTDIQTIFGRPATDLYLKNTDTRPIDPTSNGHRGAQIGYVDRILNDRGQRWLCFHTNRNLMKHDGLKIERARGEEPFNFFAREIRFADDQKKRLQFEIPADSDIEVQLPPNHPFIEPGRTVYCSASQEVRQRYGYETPRPGTYRQRKPFSASVELTATGLRLSAEGAGVTAGLKIRENLDKARQPEKTVSAIQRSFEKTGETDWRLQSLEIEDRGLFAPASILNEARRRLLDKLSKALKSQKQADHFQRLKALVQPPAEPENEERWSIKLRDGSLLDQLTADQLEQIDEIILEGDAASLPVMTAHHLPVRIAIPVIRRNFESRLTHYGSSIEAANIGALHEARESSDLTADWPLYTLNTEAAALWQELGISKMVLSPEDTGDNLKALLRILGDHAILPVYQHTPMMISATAPDSGCILSDRQNKPMTIEKNGDEFVLVYEAPFSWVEHLAELRAAGARNFRIDFTYGIHSAEEAAEIFRKIVGERPITGSYDANYTRTL